MSEIRRPNAARLFFEQIFEGGAGIVGTQACRGRRFFLPCHTDFVERAFVPRIFFCDSLLDRLHTFEAAARVKIGALLAGMQFEAAFRAVAFARCALQNCSALTATRNGAGSGHVDGARPEGIVTFYGTPAGTRLPGAFAFILAISILISGLTIFRHKFLPQARSIVHPIRAERQVEDALVA
jgi:hypothetical protein